MARRGPRRVLLFGCLGLALVLVVAVLVLGGLIWWSIDRSDSRLTVLEPDLADSAPGAVVESAQQEGVADEEPLRLLFELDSCEVFFEPGEPGEALSVHVEFDHNDYRIEEINDDDLHDYRFRFLVRGSRLISGIKQGIYGGQPQMRVRLPTGRPLVLKLLQRNGGAVVDLSGLHLVTADFDMGGALLKLDADRPLTGDLEHLTVLSRQGGMIMESVNLMAPRKIDLDLDMGQAHLDLRGEWTRDVDLNLNLRLADTLVRLPRGVRVEGLEAFGAPVPIEPPPSPNLRFQVNAESRGILRVF